MSRLEEVWYPDVPESIWRKTLLSPLLPLSWAYGSVTWARRRMYERGLLSSRSVPGLKILSVGNVNVGGTGKTPAVIHLAQTLSTRRKVAVLSRGYGRRSREVMQAGPQAGAEEVGDEPALIARRCRDAVVLVGPDRALLAQRAREAHATEVALLDDGLQHLRLRRDADVVVVDGDALFGNGQLLPRGPLREATSALISAQLVWLRLGKSESTPRALEGLAPVVTVRQRVEGLVDASGTLHPPDALKGTGVIAFAGIARPERFTATVESLGAQVIESTFYPDHAPFSSEELERLSKRAKESGLTLITTEKDAMRLPPGYPAWQVRWETEILSGQSNLDALLAQF